MKITSPQLPDNEAEMLFGKVIKTEAELLELLQPSSVLFDGRSDVRLLISVKEPSDVLAMFKHHLRLVYAGGGIVFNEHNQILLIKRNGYWDLPKGKMEAGEVLRTTAIREVQEETGVQIETASEQNIVTFHCYKMKGECCIKETHWFEMTATLGEQILVPQTEEGIERVCWAEISDLPAFKEEMYPMVWSILEAYLIAL
ncbi:MAG: NUDIX domain-containing protein [Chitinophagales bacterium]